MTIQKGAIFIADAHYNQNRKELKELLLKISSDEVQTSQLFLMGDIFDFLSDEITYFKKQNQDVIEIINSLSQTLEIVYLEGNHDFNLKNLFPKVNIISRKQQPLIATFEEKKVALAHGDIFTPQSYELYTKLIRSTIVQKILNIIDIDYWLSKKVNSWLLEKKICNKCNDFNLFAKNRIEKYSYLVDVDMIIEGHFHYGKQFESYINVPSLACAKDDMYFII